MGEGDRAQSMLISSGEACRVLEFGFFLFLRDFDCDMPEPEAGKGSWVRGGREVR